MQNYLDKEGLAKLIVRRTCEMHNGIGAASITVDGGNALDIAERHGLVVVNLTPEAKLGVIKGRKLKTKDVASYLWANRKGRALSRTTLVVWTAYAEEVDNSYLGLGAIVNKHIAVKLKGGKLGTD